MAEWKESEHPRDNAGRFTDKEGSSSSYREEVNERIKWAKENNVELPLNDDGSLNDIRLQKLYNENKEVTEKKADETDGKISKTDANAFYEKMTIAKASLSEESRWRVDIHDIGDYKNDKLFISKGGSCVAIEPNGNIISVCKHKDDQAVNGTALIQHALQNGGDRLDAFSFLYGFYIKQGFEPVSWTHFNEEYAPEGWNKNRDKPEPIIFYKYTNKITQETYEDFINRVKPSEDYDTAMSIRDKEIKK